MLRTPEEIAAEAFKRRPHTPQVSVWLDDGGSLHAVAPDHAIGGVRKIELLRPTDPGHLHAEIPETNHACRKIALAAALHAASNAIAKNLFEQRTNAIEAERTRLVEEEKLRERAMRSFDCPLTESRCTETRCSRTRCIEQEQLDDAFRRRQDALAARADTRRSRRTKVRGSKSTVAALARIAASIKL
jgi:hypothetical protein